MWIIKIMTREQYNKIFHALQTSLALGAKFDEEVARGLLNKASRARCGENVKLTVDEEMVLHQLRSIVYLTLGEKIIWKSSFY